MMSGPLDVRVSGPLVPFRDGFGEYLDGCGYARVSATNHVRVLAHVSRWMASVGLDVGELSEVEAKALRTVSVETSNRVAISWSVAPSARFDTIDPTMSSVNFHRRFGPFGSLTNAPVPASV